MNKNARQQLTLYVDKAEAGEIESIRKTYNPAQYKLIKSHVTLCREDEIENGVVVLNNLQKLDTPAITIAFGPVVRCNDGKGVLLPAVGDDEQYHQLRNTILAGTGVVVRRHEPHITLLHSRNATCTDDIFSTIQKIQLPTVLNFYTISLIEQVDGGPWTILNQYRLRDK